MLSRERERERVGEGVVDRESQSLEEGVVDGQRETLARRLARRMISMLNTANTW